MTKEEQKVYVCVATSGLHWIGLAINENHAWASVLDWPSQGDIDDYFIAHPRIDVMLAKVIADKKAAGWYVSQANVTWNKRYEIVPGME